MNLGTLLRVLALGALAAPLFAWLSFSHVFPNVSWPVIPSGMPFIVGMSLMAGALLGLVAHDIEEALAAILLSLAFGTLAAIAMYASPLLSGQAFLVLPGEYFMFFISRNILIFLIYPVGAILGAALGMLLGETILTPGRPPPAWWDRRNSPKK